MQIKSIKTLSFGYNSNDDYWKKPASERNRINQFNNNNDEKDENIGYNGTPGIADFLRNRIYGTNYGLGKFEVKIQNSPTLQKIREIESLKLEDELAELQIRNFKKINYNNVYSGSAKDSKQYLEILKENQIKNIVLLYDDEKKEYFDLCEKLGLGCLFFVEPRIEDLENPIPELKEKQRNIAAQEVVKFFKMINKGDCFMGCEYGNYRTKRAIWLSALLNPESLIKLDINDIPTEESARIFEIYKCLTKKDKKELEYTDAFEAQLKKKFDYLNLK